MKNEGFSEIEANQSKLRFDEIEKRMKSRFDLGFENFNSKKFP